MSEEAEIERNVLRDQIAEAGEESIAEAAARAAKKIHIEPCACGQTPEGLIVQAQERAKYGMVTGQCCRRWYVEFANYFEEVPDKVLANAAEAWNTAPRPAAGE